jgi:hypothetical protein
MTYYIQRAPNVKSAAVKGHGVYLKDVITNGIYRHAFVIMLIAKAKLVPKIIYIQNSVLNFFKLDVWSYLRIISILN